MEIIINGKEPTSVYRYEEYRDMVYKYAEKGLSTGPEQTKERIEATAINSQRIKRLEKKAEVLPDLKELIQDHEHHFLWVVILESWCGDGAQNIPILNKIVEQNPPYYDLRIILRDENSSIMEDHLTNGKEAIPKLICIDAEENKVLGTWGPRPLPLVKSIQQWKKDDPNMPKEELIKGVHKWYAKDKGCSLQEDLLELIPKWVKEGVVIEK